MSKLSFWYEKQHLNLNYHKYMSGICNNSSCMAISKKNLESSGLKWWGAVASLQNGHHIDTSFQSTAVDHCGIFVYISMKQL